MRITLSTGTPAEYAAPDGPAKAGLVVYPDIGGLRTLFDRMCAWLAGELEAAVVAPEPFPGREDLTLEQRLEAVRELDDRDKLADALAAAEHTRAERVWVLGFCMGGMYALKASAHDAFEKAVSFYGMIRIPGQWRSADQQDPLDVMRKRGGGHVLAIIGGRDTWTPPEDVEALRATGTEVVVYPEGEHGFVHDPDRPAHRPEDAADAWARVIAFLTGAPNP